MKKNKIIIIISVLLLFGLSVGGFLYLKAKSEYKSNVSNLSGYVLGTGVAPDLTPEEIKERDALRKEYLANFRKSFRARLENIEVVSPEEYERRMKGKKDN